MAVFVDGGAEHHTLVIFVPGGVIRTPAEKGYPEWRPRHDHGRLL